MSVQTATAKLESFKAYVRKMKQYEEAIALIYWDMRTGAPKKGIGTRSEVVGELSTEVFRMSTSDEMGEYVAFFTQPAELEQLDAISRKMVEECKKEYDRSKKIPAEKYQAYVVLTSQAESAWEDAKHNSDWDSFQPYLEKIVATTQEFIELWGYEGHKYNTLLDMYEPGMTVEKLDEVFGALREKAVPLLQRIQASPNQPDRSFLDQQFEISKQKQFSLSILKQMQYDFEAGRLDETVHPFATALNPGDVRITTRYLPNDITSALFGTIHEGGHALYEQNISDDLVGTNLCTGTSMGIHESQSRFWENVIGRSKAFWDRYYGELQTTFSPQIDQVDVDTFYKAINHIEPSLIRIEADELTYNLHIMIRYELEKGLFNGTISVADLPAAWNAKYEEYLGVTPANDGEGVLQDVHWSGGAFGYFPSYALGNMYAAQFTQTLRKELPAFESLIAEGNLAPIKEWLTEKVYKHGKLLTPNEIIRQVTGEELNPEYLVQYLEEKYKSVYGI
ncbi:MULTISPECIES: carboxypeptidase M32 [Paenibacillus]|uniref:Metal-dependent carboxypeptidase n=1 Tax=Paenibacillus violae TaxID=3077234 RepID=A0ABU3R761_9BACL|nr:MULTISPECIES: carboxypeptidase M32 [Paenibacillus]MDU0200104.1 carboxypeptidase M32 [Paenibacillus sp. PFR10]MEC0270870.1 carboxypeptidase M32 [Paenibacillus anseongense]